MEQENNQQESEQMKQFQAVMLWKLGLGHMGRYFNGENPLPDKNEIATKDSWKTESMPNEDVSRLQMGITVTDEDMEIIRRGHIPEAQEDHWFMCCDDEYIRYYRSWTGMCAFEADQSGAFLFIYLLVAETGADATPQWNAYLDAWTDTHFKYADRPDNGNSER